MNQNKASISEINVNLRSRNVPRFNRHFIGRSLFLPPRFRLIDVKYQTCYARRLRMIIQLPITFIIANIVTVGFELIQTRERREIPGP